MPRAYLGLGSNLGNRWDYLHSAVTVLARHDPGLAVSPVYETTPVGGSDGQGPYLNCVVGLTTTLSPEALLVLAQGLEQAAERVRAERFGPRTLDVDVLWYEGVASDDPALTLPHARMAERAFVLAPLADIAPHLVDAAWRARLGGDDVVDAAVRRVGALVHAPGAGESSTR